MFYEFNSESRFVNVNQDGFHMMIFKCSSYNPNMLLTKCRSLNLSNEQDLNLLYSKSNILTQGILLPHPHQSGQTDWSVNLSFLLLCFMLSLFANFLHFCDPKSLITQKLKRLKRNWCLLFWTNIKMTCHTMLSSLRIYIFYEYVYVRTQNPAFFYDTNMENSGLT